MRRPSPPTVISLVALFVALGGTSYAVTRLPRNSVGSAQVKPNSLTGSDIRNGSLHSSDLSPGARGVRGPRGPEGPAGPPGAGSGDSTVEAWHAMTLAPGWSNYGGSFSQAAYRKDSRGRVYLRGLVKKDGLPKTDDVIATLPAGYRPTGRAVFAAAGGSPPTYTRVDARPDGSLLWINGGTAEGDFTSLATIAFWTD